MAKRGRPTKYQAAKTIEQVYAIASFLADNPEKFLEACGIEQVADGLGVCVDTIYEWEKQYPYFSEAIKVWQTTRNATLYKLAKSLPPAIWIFMTKNMLNWRDKQGMEVSGAEGGPVRVLVEKVITDKRPSEGGDE